MIRGRAQAFETSDRAPEPLSCLKERESSMYARKVSLCLRSEFASQFLKKIEYEVIPLLRKQRGFLDQLIIVSDSGNLVYVYTFWENRGAAERYDCTTLPMLNQLLAEVVYGQMHIHAFGGTGGRLSGG